MKDQLTEITVKLENDDVVPVEMNERLEELKDKKDILLTDKEEIVSKLTTLHSVNQLTTEKLQDRQAEQSDIKRNIADMKEQIEQ